MKGKLIQQESLRELSDKSHIHKMGFYLDPDF
jgi:hypothetical protein